MDTNASLPPELIIFPSTIPGSNLGVFCATSIKHGTKMGPYPGRIVTSCDCRNKPMDKCWEILLPNNALLAYLNADSCHDNWLANVQCARAETEQNLELVQVGSQIYYRATKDIQRGDELLVWYGASYTLYMGLPVTSGHTTKPLAISGDVNVEPVTSVDVINEQSLKNTNTDKKDLTREANDDHRWRCVLCRRGFNSRSNLRSHMRIHTLERPFTCSYCARRFSQSSTLRNHIRLHTGEKPYTCVTCKSSYSQLAGLRAHQRSSAHRPPMSGRYSK
ncbi:PR domain zinc finger protein 12-like [Dreissena polymorpha]|uniref:PR domain zinc finger protein 12-like n=1 Tax=Dreissena polymorpha TaxID=45954 RepID=UPI0022650D9E|nr:PR domain zinc finger protein 12-like [Dreissena polymorpha]